MHTFPRAYPRIQLLLWLELRSNSAHEPSEPLAGCTPHSRRTAQVGDCRGAIHGGRIFALAPQAAFPGSKITALVSEWGDEDSVVRSDTQGFGVAGSFSKCAFASIVW